MQSFNFDSLLADMLAFWDDAYAIFLDGGWAMIAIGLTALAMFALGMHVHLKLRSKGFESISEQIWRRWIDHPEERHGKVGEMLTFVTGGKTIQDTELFFEELRSVEIVPFERDLKVMKICVSATPLLGLLGTVMGMLDTFGALASGSGGDQTMSMVAGGISEALITTETGLVMALAGVFFTYHLSRKHECYEAFLAHMETVCLQNLNAQLLAEKLAASADGNANNPNQEPAPPRAEPIENPWVDFATQHEKMAMTAGSTSLR